MKEYRKFREKTLLIASSNLGKVRELRKLLSGYDINLVSLEGYDLPIPEETELTFIGNAELKAKYYCKNIGLPCIADDSGLSVVELDNQPGIYSARWAGEELNFDKAMQKIELALAEKNMKNSAAYFTCALSIVWPDGHVESFEGIVHGEISFPARGSFGFGYDPIFVQSGYNKTYAQMTPDEKASINHRRRAFTMLVENCFQ